MFCWLAKNQNIKLKHYKFSIYKLTGLATDIRAYSELTFAINSYSSEVVANYAVEAIALLFVTVAKKKIGF